MISGVTTPQFEYHCSRQQNGLDDDSDPQRDRNTRRLEPKLQVFPTIFWEFSSPPPNIPSLDATPQLGIP